MNPSAHQSVPTETPVGSAPANPKAPRGRLGRLVAAAHPVALPVDHGCGAGLLAGSLFRRLRPGFADLV